MNHPRDAHRQAVDSALWATYQCVGVPSAECTKQVRAVLADLAGPLAMQSISERKAVVAVVRSGIVPVIRSGVSDPSWFEAQAQHLAAMEGISVDDARWAVTSWRRTLGANGAQPFESVTEHPGRSPARNQPADRFVLFLRRGGGFAVDIALLALLVCLPALLGIALAEAACSKPGCEQLSSGETSAIVALVAFLELAVVVAFATFYIVRPLSRHGRTFGMRLASVRLQDAKTGAPPTAGRATARMFATLASPLFCGLGFLWSLWDTRCRTWQDLIAETEVLPA